MGVSAADVLGTADDCAYEAWWSDKVAAAENGGPRSRAAAGRLTIREVVFLSVMRDNRQHRTRPTVFLLFHKSISPI